MVDNSKNLEEKVEKPNWKQWIPVYGLYQVVKDSYQGKPTVADIMEQGPGVCLGSAIYQALSVVGAYMLSEHITIDISLNL